MASPRAHMRKWSAHPRKLPGLESRLATLVGKRARLGQQINLHQLGSVPQTPKEKALYERIREEKRRGESRSLSEKKLAELRVKELVLRVSTRFRKRLGGRDPTVYQILAAIALRYGLHSQPLDDAARIMSTTALRYPHLMSWEGFPNQIRSAIKRGIPKKIEEVLFARKEAISSRELAESIGEVWDQKGKRSTVYYVNASMQLLESMGLVKKMPPSSVDKAMAMWVHRSHRNPPMRYYNTGFHLLERLATGRKFFTDLYRQRNTKGAPIGNPREVFGMHAVHRTLRDLERAGLATLTRTRLTNLDSVRKTGTVVIGEAELTPEGMRLMKQYAETHSLPEKLRRLLLWQREEKLEKKKKEREGG